MTLVPSVDGAPDTFVTFGISSTSRLAKDREWTEWTLSQGREMNSDRALAALMLFNQKAERLKNLSFANKYATSGNRVVIRATNIQSSGSGDLEVKTTRVDDESTDAVVLTLRFFIQDNESCSFRNLSKVYGTEQRLSVLAPEFEHHRSRLNVLLQTASEPQPPKGQFEGTLCLVDILHTFVYGSLAHAADPKKKELFERWMNEPVAEAIFTAAFQRLLMGMIQIIDAVARLNVKAIHILKG